MCEWRDVGLRVQYAPILGFLMLQILDTSVNDRGEVIRNRPLPLIFDSKAQAAFFMQAYLKFTFANGRSGYEPDYWWACSNKSDLVLHRFTMVEGPTAPQ
jgi:hypothetical protein